jgi:hypothetical protein
MDGWVDGSKSRFKDCLRQSKNIILSFCADVEKTLKVEKNLN